MVETIERPAKEVRHSIAEARAWVAFRLGNGPDPRGAMRRRNRARGLVADGSRRRASSGKRDDTGDNRYQQRKLRPFEWDPFA